MKKLFVVISFSNLSGVPKNIRWIKPDDSIHFKGTEIPGLLGTKVNLQGLLEDLEADGLSIQDVFAQKRISEKKMFFTTVRVEFGKKRKAIDEEMPLRETFVKIFEDAFWNIKVFGHDNDVTVACSCRAPRYEGNDRLKPVTIWDKDPVTKERIGDKPKPIQPEHLLSFEDGELVLYKF